MKWEQLYWNQTVRQAYENWALPISGATRYTYCHIDAV